MPKTPLATDSFWDRAQRNPRLVGSDGVYKERITLDTHLPPKPMNVSLLAGPVYDHTIDDTNEATEQERKTKIAQLKHS